MGLNFTDVSTHAPYVPYNRAFLTGLIFAVRQSSAKTMKIGLLKKFPLYGSDNSRKTINRHRMWYVRIFDH